MKACQTAATILLAVVLRQSAGAHADADVTPLNKVVQMLGDMAAKGKQEKHEEEVEFAKFKAWCDSTRKETTESIEKGKAAKVQLEADIESAEADVETLAGEIADLEKMIATDEKELAAAKAIREKEKADYDAEHKDLSDTIDAAERAIDVLKSRNKDVKQSLIQVSKSLAELPRAQAIAESLLAFGEGQEQMAGVPEANAYEFQSGGAVAMLEKLRLKFQDERLALEKEELSKKNNFEVLAQRLSDNIKNNNAVSKKKTSKKAQRMDEAAEAKSDLERTVNLLAEDVKKLATTNTDCAMRSQEFDGNQVVRAQEIQAIKKAVEILQSPEVMGSADKHLPAAAAAALLQRRASHKAIVAALVQVSGGDGIPSEARQRTAAFLQDRARKLGSRYLAMVASRLDTDPFEKVKKMIKELIVKLMEEANSEADSKAFCDTELATNKQTRENKAEEVEELTARIEKHSAESAQLATEVKELSAAIAAILKEQDEATKLRTDEKVKNAQVVKEAILAQEGVQRAVAVLRDFYGSQGGSFLQSQDGDELGAAMRQASSAPYTGMQAENGGIIGFLDVVLSDFARLQTETEGAEQEAQGAYEKFMAESKEDAAVKQTEMDHKDEKRRQLDSSVEKEKKELALTQEELDAALEYYEKLKPDCLDQGLSYEDRVRAREEEMQSLKEALQMLDQQ